jgi:hypothetical protein
MLRQVSGYVQRLLRLVPEMSSGYPAHHSGYEPMQSKANSSVYSAPALTNKFSAEVPELW